MHPKFLKFLDSINESFEKLMASVPIRDALFPNQMPKRGVYLYSENGRPLYVGRTNNLRNRYDGHTLESSRDQSAPFAFKLAREATGKLKPSYRPGPDSRKGLMQNSDFVEAFRIAKLRVRRMDHRFVEEIDPTRQFLLEAYCCIVLETPYNDFENH